MGFFDDDEEEGRDPFEEIMNEFFGNRSRVRTSSSGNVVNSEMEERVIDYIQEDDSIYFVFELSGFSKDDVKVDVKGNILDVSAQKKNASGIKSYLKDKLSRGVSFSKRIPVKFKGNESWTFNNGILEVKFKRK
ncbi:MAG: hypothetical protein QT05_C0048G0048 [archaeon GW2011_AR13]|nr:MAG: hypothetical protein QT05_C0048G0048 [archaeon GW2011_AR13]HIG94131.1 Hsp20/alpha crystallin family protein [Nanoarchaeota archaeon]HIH63940.1 Hsp20/alpha crystallin family protein [Nanoarchaeota archaeon]HIJ09718.1 Hsp20/alpha crystallin family protein [Nanoarchaeota archaeon]